MVYLVHDLLEEIFLQLPLKSIIKFKALSKQWRSILESRRFAERRHVIMNNLQKKPQIMVAIDKQTIPRLKGEEEVELFYLHCKDADTRPSLTSDGLVCMPVPGYVNVLNPSTGEFLSFPSGPNPVNYYNHQIVDDSFPAGYATMGFGKDIVSGTYKVVRRFFCTEKYEILDISIGEWRKLASPRPPPYYVEGRKKSSCVNGSIYWLHVPYLLMLHDLDSYKILALDLHTEEFRVVPKPPSVVEPHQLVNLENRLAIATVYCPLDHLELGIWSMDTQEEIWSKTYTIRISTNSNDPYTLWLRYWCRPVAVSKKGNLFFYDSENRLFKYYPETDQVRIIEKNIRVISPFVENLSPLRSLDSIPKTRTYGFQNLDDLRSSRISKFFKRIDLRRPTVLFTTAAVALVAFHFSPLSV